MKTTQNRIHTTSKVVAVIAKILYITLIIAVCLELVGCIWHSLSPNTDSFLVGHVKVVSPLASSGVISDLFTGIASQSFFIAILINTYRIFKDISREYSPFLAKNIRRMKKIALLLFIDSLVSPPIDMLVRKSLELETANMPDFSSEMIVLALVIYCFALIFQYGAELQKQSDETL